MDEKILRVSEVGGPVSGKILRVGEVADPVDEKVDFVDEKIEHLTSRRPPRTRPPTA